MRKIPNEVCAIAALPTVAKADAASRATDIIRPATVVLTADKGEADDGDVGLLPAQADSHVPAAIIVAAPHACAQNSLRVCIAGLKSCATSL